MTTMSNPQIRRESSFGELKVSRVYVSQFQKKNTLTAEIKQEITTKTYYPSQSISNSLSDNIFDVKDFAIEEQEFTNTETRVSWLDVPAGTTLADVNNKLANVPEARLQKIVSNHPILSEQDKRAIANGLTTLDAIAEKQVLRYPASHVNAGELVLDNNGKPQYRRISFVATAKADEDLRTADKSDFYAPLVVARELNAFISTGVVPAPVVMNDDIPF